MFGDLYYDMHDGEMNDSNLKPFLEHINLYRYTKFFEWKDGCEQVDYRVGRENINFHRSCVWIARIPKSRDEKSPEHKKFVGLLRCIPMMLLWRKRATEACFHPKRLKFEVD
jgi:hypothetical protein